MFELLGMFSSALGMFGKNPETIVVFGAYNIASESDDPLITESSDNIITE